MNKVFFFLVFVLLFFYSCPRSPRTNPYDPESPQTVLGNIQGEIEPVPSDVKILLTQGNDSISSVKPQSSGKFEFKYIEKGIYSIEITASGYLTSLIENVRVIEKKTTDLGKIVLIPETPDTTQDSLRILSGRVINSDDLTGVSGAIVQVDGRDTTTDENGNFTFVNLKPKVYTVKVMKEGFLTLITSVDLSQNSANITLLLEAVAILEGTVTSTNNNPLSNVKVSLPGFTTYTNSQGYYKFEGLPENTYIVSYEKTGYITKFKEVTLKKGQVKTVDVQLQPKDNVGVVKGTVKDWSTNSPLEGVTVYGGNSATYTNNNGFYSMEVQTGTFKVYFEKDGYYPKSSQVTVNAGQTVTLNISLVPYGAIVPDTGTLSGVVVDSVTGERIDLGYFAIRLFTPDESHWVGWNKDSTVNGNYEIWRTDVYPSRKGIPTGEYIIVIYGWSLPEPYLPYSHRVTINQGTNTHTIRLKKGGNLMAFVYDKLDQSPVPGAFLSFYNGPGGSTNNNGFAKISRIPLGFQQLYISKAGYHSESYYMSFDYGETKIQEFYLTPFADVWGIVKDSTTGNVLSNVLVQIGNRQTYTDQNGKYFFDAVEDGNYYISFSKEGYNSKILTIDVPYTGELRVDVELIPAGI